MSESGKKGRVRLKVVPWINKLEFETVWKSLYSNNPTDQRWAVDRVSVWALRGHGEDLACVETTAALVRAKIQDYAVQNNISVCTFDDISPMYCMALIRFVSLITEKGQDHEHHLPLRQVAHKFDIPDWIIELRHQASHSSVPSLEKLRKGAEVCLQWLDDNYWKPEMENTRDYCPTTDNADEVECREALLNFQSLQSQSFFSPAKSVGKGEMKLVISHITKLAKHNGKCLVKTLAKPEFLLSWTACSRALVESSDPYIQGEAVALPRTMGKFWLPVICVVYQKDLLEELVLCLLTSVKQLCEESQRMAFSWVWQIVSCSCESWQSPTKEDSELYKLLKDRPPIFNWFQLMEACLYSYSKYMPAVLPILMDHVFPPIPTDKKNRLMGLVAIATGALADASAKTDVSSKTDVPDKKNQRIYNVDDIKTVLELQNVIDKGETSLYHTENLWKKCTDDIDWAAYPLGYVFGVGKGPVHPRALEMASVSGEGSADKDISSSKTTPVPMECEMNKPVTESTEVSVDKDRNEDDLKVEDDEPYAMADEHRDEEDSDDDEPCASGHFYCDPEDIFVL